MAKRGRKVRPGLPEFYTALMRLYIADGLSIRRAAEQLVHELWEIKIRAGASHMRNSYMRPKSDPELIDLSQNLIQLAIEHFGSRKDGLHALLNEKWSDEASSNTEATLGDCSSKRLIIKTPKSLEHAE